MHFNFKVFWAWVFSSLYHGTLIFYLSFYSLIETDGGLTFDMAAKSTVAFSMIMHATTFKLFISLNYLSWQTILVSISLLIIYYAILVVLGLPALVKLTSYEFVDLAPDIVT
jgi:hypothetical protein